MCQSIRPASTSAKKKGLPCVLTGASCHVASGRSAPKRRWPCLYPSELQALQGTAAQAQGKQGGEQTEPDDGAIAQIDFHPPPSGTEIYGTDARREGAPPGSE